MSTKEVKLALASQFCGLQLPGGCGQDLSCVFPCGAGVGALSLCLRCLLHYQTSSYFLLSLL